MCIRDSLGSPWVGFEHFETLFGMEKFYSVVWNTIYISVIRLIFGFPFPIIIALMLNEVRSSKLRKSIQTAVYIPNFISRVVLGGILTNMLLSLIHIYGPPCSRPHGAGAWIRRSGG